jgi:hypothetical protein
LVPPTLKASRRVKDYETYIEYPESSKDGWIGHLFSLDPDMWYDPSTNFVHPMGEPKGKSKKGKPAFVGF